MAKLRIILRKIVIISEKLNKCREEMNIHVTWRKLFDTIAGCFIKEKLLPLHSNDYKALLTK